LWSAFASEIPVAVERGSDYLNWRFVENPLGPYAIYEFHEDDRLQGYVVFRVANKHGGRIGYIMELIYETDRPQVGKHLLRYALQEMAADGAELALAWCLRHSPNRRAYRNAGFLRFPERFRPIELHFGARRLAYSGPISITDRQGWYISYADSDTV